MNAFDLLKILLKQYSSVEDLLKKLQNYRNRRHYQEDSPHYYEEVIKILDHEIQDLNKSLNEKIRLKKEFEKKMKDYRANEEAQKERERQKSRQEEQSYRHSSGSGSSGGYQRGRHTTTEEKLAKYYAALEIPYGSNLETVKKAYRTLLKKYHPDFYLHDAEKQKTATQLTQKLSEAYQFLEKHLSRK